MHILQICQTANVFFRVFSVKRVNAFDKNYYVFHVRPKQKTLVSGQRSASRFIYFLPTSEMYVRGYWNQTKFPICKVWWLRERPHKSSKSLYPYVKKSFKIPIDPAILAAIGHRFIAKTWNHGKAV